MLSQQPLEDSFLTWINMHRHPILDHLFLVVTWAGSLYLLVPLATVLLGCLLFLRKWGDAGLLGLGFGGAVAITHLAKILISRPRPDLFPPLIPMPADFSFPSAHTAQVTAFAFCLALLVCRDPSSALCWLIGLTGAVMIGGVGLSRIYLQVHYVSDVVAGAVVAMAWVAGIRLLLGRVFPSSFP